MSTQPDHPTDQAISTAQAAIAQADKDIGEYQALFLSWQQSMHPQDVDFSLPISELNKLTSLIKDNCYKNLEDEVKDMDSIGSEATEAKLKILQDQAKRVADESDKVEKGFATAFRALELIVGPSTSRQVEAGIHATALTDAEKGLVTDIAANQKAIQDGQQAFDTSKKSLDDHSRDLAETSEKLRKETELMKTYEYNLSHIRYGRGSDFGLGSMLGAKASSATSKGYKDAVTSLEAIVRKDKETFGDKQREKTRITDLKTEAEKLKVRVVEHLSGAQNIRVQAEKWRNDIKSLETQWKFVNDHIKDVHTASHQLEKDTKVLRPTSGRFSKHVLNVVDQLSRFVGYKGVLAGLEAIMGEIRKANDLTDEEEDIQELAARLYHEEQHLKMLSTQVAGSQGEGLKPAPEPLGLESGSFDTMPKEIKN